MKAITICLLAIVTIISHAQSNSSTFYYRIGDELETWNVTDIQTGDCGDNAVWDFSGIKPVYNGDKIIYTHDVDNDNSIATVKGDTRFYHQQDSTYIKLHGYENNTTKIKYDRPFTIIPLPIYLGNSCSGVFHGCKMYCEKLMMRQIGTYSTDVDAKGIILLPNGVTLDNAYRVKTITTTCDIIYDWIDTEKKLIAYIDSVQPFTADDIEAYMMSNKYKVRTTETYSWYAKGFRYPILVKTIYGNEIYDSKEEMSYYCPPDEQKHIYDPENETAREQILLCKQSKQSKYDEDINGDSSQEHPYEMNVIGDVINIHHKAKVSIFGLLSDSSGIVYKKATGDTSSPLQIDCHGLRKSEYVMFLEIDGIRYTSKVKI